MPSDHVGAGPPGEDRAEPAPVPGDPTHHPGPPRATSVGEPVELAPRGVDAVVAVGPDGARTDRDGHDKFAWRLAGRPAGSEATLADGPVVELAPDVPGTYVAVLEAPDGTHEQTVRVFPDERRERTLRVARDAFDAPAARVTPDRVSVAGTFNDWGLAEERPRADGDALEYDLRLPPGEHPYSFAFEDDLSTAAGGEAVVPGPGRPRVHLSAEPSADGEAVRVTADARAAPAGADPSVRPAGADPTVEWLFDDRDDLAREDVTISEDGTEVRIPLSAIPREPPEDGDVSAGEGVARLHATPVAERYGVTDTVELSRPAESTEEPTAVRTYRPNDPPSWAVSPTVYEVFVRSFAGRTPTATFRELERRVPYLASLHVDVLWLTPVLQSPTTHGYHVTDYARTAEDLGSRAEFESLVDACHARDIRVVFDLVINHTSRDHPAFQLHAAGVEAFDEQYARRGADANPSGVEWAGEGTPEFRFNWERIPDLNYESPTVRAWMKSVVDRWAPLVDGFRCDIAWGVPHGFWTELAESLRRERPDFLLLDETIPRDPFAHESAFDMHYDTTLYETLRRVGTGDADADALLDAVESAAVEGFPDAAAHLRYVENHDERRYRAECGTAALTAAAAATFTLPGAPMLYYGQERGMTDYRGPMAWHDGDAALTAYHRRLAAARDDHELLRTGTLERVEYEVSDGDSDDGPLATATGGDFSDFGDFSEDAGAHDEAVAGETGVTAFARASPDGDERLLVALNFGAEPLAVEFPEPVAPTDLLSGADVSTGQTGEPTRTVAVADAVVCRVR